MATIENSKFVGDQLRIARLSYGLSLEQIAESVSATRQYIHQLENGSRKPSDEMAEALAHVLGVKVEFLFFSQLNDVRPEQCHFRKQASTPVSVVSQVLARGTMLDRLATLLDFHLGLPKVNFPDFPVKTMSDVELAADRARKYWGLGEGPITSMVRVVENAGAIVTEFKGLSDRVDAHSMDRPRPIIVRNDAKSSLCRQRFDLAHECGHLVMHRGLETGDKITESQAHRFASAFLFPKNAFISEFPRGKTLNWPEMYTLKLRWKMAVRAIVRRAYDLDLIDAAQYRTANIQIVKMGQSKVEKYDDRMEMEKPELLEVALMAFKRHKSKSIFDLTKEMKINSKMFQLITGQELPDEPQVNDENIICLSDFRQ